MRIFFIALLLLSQLSLAQTFTDSNLPIVLITTDHDSNGNPIEIPDDPKVSATMKIIKRPDGSRNYITDATESAYLNYNGKIAIEVRGSTSQDLPKKPYGLTTVLANGNNNNVSLLGMPSENDWVLNSFAYDETMMRDYIAYHLSRQMGQYASRAVYCEVVVNGDYKGLYLLSEKIKIDGNRVNITKMTSSDQAIPALTGGYIVKADKTTGGDPIAWTMPSNHHHHPVNFILESPKPEDITLPQSDYIKSVFKQMADQTHANVTEGYPALIDVPTFVDFMLLGELASNVDVYQFSTFFHKDRNGKLRAGPVWDYNFSFGNDAFSESRSKSDVWQFANEDNTGAKFWKDLFDDATFHCYLSRRYQQLTQTGQPLAYASIHTLVDQTTDLISEALVREHTRWQTIPDHAQAVADLKTWLQLRMQWMNDQLADYSDCENIAPPSLVISKIHYNPKTSESFPVSNDMEFIEIRNTGSTAVDLTGIYFSELGLSYQFPSQSTLPAGGNLYLASNASVFLSKHGFPAFGQFTRNLSNSSQKLVLSDAFGNTIDVVHYADRDPWPSAADGTGQWLELMDTGLDNNVASNWISSSAALILSNDQAAENSSLTIYPNPATNELSVKAATTIHTVELLDLLGESLKQEAIESNQGTIDLSAYKNGVYFLKIRFANGSKIEKVIKH